MKRSLLTTVICILLSMSLLVGCQAEQNPHTPTGTQDSASETSVPEQETEAPKEEVCYEEGYTLVQSNESPTGYYGVFVYNANADTRDQWFAEIPEDANVIGVQLCGTFLLEGKDSLPANGTDHGFDSYKNGDFSISYNPATMTYEWYFDMVYNEATGNYEAQIPMISGSHYYYYRVYVDKVLYQMMNQLTGEMMDINFAHVDDPANPSQHAENMTNSNYQCSDLSHSICYGLWDSVKQSESPNRDFMTPYGDHAKGTVEYVTYAGSLAEDQDLGIYLPPDYDANRAKPYNTIYLSHGMGGNETYWFSTPQADNIMDHVIAEDKAQEAIIVCLDNSSYDWNYSEIENNIRNYVIPYIEANYNVRTDKEGRAFAGFSMGAMTTTHMMFHCSDLFKYFGVLSGCNIGNATFAEGFEYDSSRLSMTESEDGGPIGEEYLKQVYENIVISDDLKDAIVYTAAGNYDTASKLNGFGLYGCYETIRDWAATYMPEGHFVDGGYIPGSHDSYTWGPGFYEFAGSICWN